VLDLLPISATARMKSLSEGYDFLRRTGDTYPEIKESRTRMVGSICLGSPSKSKTSSVPMRSSTTSAGLCESRKLSTQVSEREPRDNDKPSMLARNLELHLH
jgi:hypothetical protein